MRPLDHFAEPFSPTGSLASEGQRNQLGRPRIGPIELLVREAVQNCWDAKRRDSSQVSVTFELKELSGTSLDVLRDIVFANLPPDGQSGVIRDAKRLLLIADRGTHGLGGVLRANEDGNAEPRDFVDFIRNSGQPPDTDLGGGTYGYGKVALYLASRVQTIVVHTRCRHRGQFETRLIACRLGDQHAHQQELFTGRHWWGRLAADGVIDPALDDEAREIAASLGLPAFADEETGTTIAIIEPHFGVSEDVDAMSLLAEAIAWNFWPKMVAVDGAAPPMRFAVALAGEAIPIPDGSVTPVLKAFRTAYLALKSLGVGEEGAEAPGARTMNIECQRPTAHLGKLSLLKFPNSNGAPESEHAEEGEEDDDGMEHPGIRSGRVHHTALLRAPELVVKYLSGPANASPMADYAGVFIADAERDRVFATSEPPSHDDWVPDGLAGSRDRTFVRVANRRIKEAMSDFSGVERLTGRQGGGASLGGVADLLSGLLPALEGPSAQVRPAPEQGGGGGGTGGARGRAKVRIDGSPSLGLIAGIPAVTVRFTAEVPEGATPVRIKAKPSVLVEEGSRESAAPLGAALPEILTWCSGDGPILAQRVAEYVLTEPGVHTLTISASVPSDARVGISITASGPRGDHG